MFNQTISLTEAHLFPGLSNAQYLYGQTNQFFQLFSSKIVLCVLINFVFNVLEISMGAEMNYINFSKLVTTCSDFTVTSLFKYS